MAKIAKFIGAPYVIAGQYREIYDWEFLYYDNDNLIISPVISSISLVFHSGPITIIADNKVYGYKHINSTRPQDDEANISPNTINEDFQLGNAFVKGTIQSSDGQIFTIDIFRLTYYAAAYSPNFPIERVRGLYRSSSNDYVGIVYGATINKYSPVKPDAVLPNSVTELIGYAPNMVGELHGYDELVTVTNTVTGANVTCNTTLFKYPIVTANLSNVRADSYIDGNKIAQSPAVNFTSGNTIKLPYSFPLVGGAADTTYNVRTVVTNADGAILFETTKPVTVIGANGFTIASTNIEITSGYVTSDTFTLADSSFTGWPTAVAIDGRFIQVINGTGQQQFRNNLLCQHQGGGVYKLPVESWSYYTAYVEYTVKINGIAIGQIISGTLI